MAKPSRLLTPLLAVLVLLPGPARSWWGRRPAPVIKTVLQCEGEGWTPLTCAASQGRPRLIQLFLSRGAPVDQTDGTLGATALHWAALHRHDDVVRILLNHGASVNARNRAQGTPLHWAAKSGDARTAAMLIDHGAQLDALNSTGQTPLMVAAASGNAAVAKVLTARGAQAGRAERAVARPAAPALKASDVDKPRYKLAENTDDFALVIGIERYSDIPEAEFAERDAAAMRDHLVALGYPERNIVSLLGPKATKSGIIKNVETWLPKNVDAKSTVFVYYSGHGAPDPKSGRSYLVPWDGDPAFLEDTAYPLKRLYEKLNALQAKRVIVAMDSCFSGAGGRSVLAKGLRPLVTKTGSDLSAGKTVSLSAAGGDQVSGTFEAQGHGLFTYYLLRGLNGEAKDGSGAVTLGSLFGYVSTHVQDAARRANGDQTPQLAPPGAEKEPWRLR